MANPRPTATEAGIEKFEKRIGAVLPADYRRFLLERNGGQPDESRCVFAYASTRGTINSLHTLDAEQTRFDLLERWKLSRDTLPGDLLPIGPRVGWFDRRDVIRVATSFQSFMDALGPYE